MRATASPAARAAEGGGGAELWRLFLGLALAFLVAEQLVAMRGRVAA